MSILGMSTRRHQQMPWASKIWLSMLLHPAQTLLAAVGLCVSFIPKEDFLRMSLCPALIMMVLSSFWCVNMSSLAMTIACVFYRLLLLMESGCRFLPYSIYSDPIERFCLDRYTCLLLAISTVVLLYTLSVLVSFCTMISMVIYAGLDTLPSCQDMTKKWNMLSRQCVGLIVLIIAVFIVLAIPFLMFCQWKDRQLRRLWNIQAPGEPEGLLVEAPFPANYRPAPQPVREQVLRPAPPQRAEPLRNTTRSIFRYYDSRRTCPIHGTGRRGPFRRPAYEDDSRETDVENDGSEERREDGDETDAPTDRSMLEGDSEVDERKDVKESFAPTVGNKTDVTANRDQVTRNENLAHTSYHGGTAQELKPSPNSNPATHNEANQEQHNRRERTPTVDRNLTEDDLNQQIRDIFVGEPHIPVPVQPPNEGGEGRKNKLRFPFSKVDHQPFEVPFPQERHRRRAPFPFSSVVCLTGGTYLAVYGSLSVYLIFSPIGPSFSFDSTAFTIFCHFILIKGIIDSVVYLVASQV